MLTFIGLGLYDKTDISIKGFQAIQKADIVYLENYTSKLMGSSKKELEEYYNKKIILLSRNDVELNFKKILDKAKTKNVVFLTPGDTMISTTHINLKINAIKKNIDTNLIYGSSIHTAICSISGLQNYKFGKSTSISFPYVSNKKKRIISDYPYDTIIKNYKNNLHTLVYLDLNTEKERFMTVKEALEILLEIANKKSDKLIPNLLAIGISQVGSKNENIKLDFIKNFNNFNIGPPLQILIIPGKLHIIEVEALHEFTKTPISLLNMYT